MKFGIFFELSVPRPFTPTKESEVYFNACLLQVDVEHHLTRAERYFSRLNAYAATAWGEARVEPNYPVVASGGSGRLELSPVRFAGRPQELAFTGTEKIA